MKEDGSGKMELYHAFLIFSCVSTFASLVCVLTVVFLPKLRKFPTTIFLNMFIASTILSAAHLISFVGEEVLKQDGWVCKVQGCFVCFALWALTLWNLIFAINIPVSLLKPDLNPVLLSRIYHVIAWTVPVIALVIFEWQGLIGFVANGFVECNINPEVLDSDSFVALRLTCIVVPSLCLIFLAGFSIRMRRGDACWKLTLCLRASAFVILFLIINFGHFIVKSFDHPGFNQWLEIIFFYGYGVLMACLWLFSKVVSDAFQDRFGDSRCR